MTDNSQRLIAELSAGIADIRAIRRDIHAHPELCFEEWRTADIVAARLEAWGIESHRGLAQTGVVGVLKAGAGDRAIGLRADMDALPMHEDNRFPHASTYPGRMHACGHDGHTAMLLAAARQLAARPNFSGTVYLIFQPAEENGGGAEVMIREGLFQRFPMQAVYGMHNAPGLPAGTFAASPGPVMAAFAGFRIVIEGEGCHAAMPHLGLDPVPVAAQLILALQTILTRNLNPLDNAVLSVTTLHVGETSNIIAPNCEMTGTVRAFSRPVLERIEARMREVSQGICQAHGLRCRFEFSCNYPATVNHADHVALARRAMTALVGHERVLAQEPTMGAEDFAFMLQQLPGCYCFIGNGGGEHRHTGHGLGPCTLHNGSYDFNDDILALGAAYWVNLVGECLPAA